MILGGLKLYFILTIYFSSFSFTDYMTKGASRGDVPLEEGAEWDWLPAQLCADLTLLILEGRQPEWSVKGRKEGDHCPPARGTSMHQCRLSKEAVSPQVQETQGFMKVTDRKINILVPITVRQYPKIIDDVLF